MHSIKQVNRHFNQICIAVKTLICNHASIRPRLVTVIQALKVSTLFELVQASEISLRATKILQTQEIQIKVITRVKIKQTVLKEKWRGKILEQIRAIVHKVCHRLNETKILAIHSLQLLTQESKNHKLGSPLEDPRGCSSQKVRIN